MAPTKVIQHHVTGGITTMLEMDIANRKNKFAKLLPAYQGTICSRGLDSFIMITWYIEMFDSS